MTPARNIKQIIKKHTHTVNCMDKSKYILTLHNNNAYIGVK